MNILLIGSGGREHALAWKMAQSPRLSHLFIAPGNAGTASLGTNVDIDPNSHSTVQMLLMQEKIDMVVVGPEEPLVRGLHDAIISSPITAHIPVIGPQALGAQLEGSKEFAKEFMVRHSIPTARYLSVTSDNIAEGDHFLSTLKPPYVLKADGLAAGKGVLIINDIEEARSELRAMLGGKFGKAGNTVVIEEYLSGIELSVFVLTDGHGYVILPEAKDYKRIGEGDTGLNTGGMGAVSPVPFADKEFMRKVEERIVHPTVEGLAADNIPYKGFIFIGLMNCNGDPYVIEYNVRMGDPETEVVIPRIESDLIEMFEAVAQNRIGEFELKVKPETCCTVMMVSGGYPGSYEKGKLMTGMEQTSGSMLFHAGTKQTEQGVVTNGGRVIAVSSLGKDKNEALAKSYANVSLVKFDGSYYRRDIGRDLDAYMK